MTDGAAIHIRFMMFLPLECVQGANSHQSASRPTIARSIATVMLSGHWDNTGTSPRLSRRRVNLMRDCEKHGRKNPENDEPSTKTDSSSVQMHTLRSRRLRLQRTKEADQAEAEGRHG